MKKLFAIIVVLAMLLSAAAFADSAEVVGTWNLNEIVLNGATMSPADLGAEMSITLNEDGTAEMKSNMSDDGNETGTWTLEGDQLTITDGSGSPATLTFADGKLTMSMGDEGSMIFTQDAAQEGYAPAAANAAATLEDYAGKWVAVKVGMDGRYFPAETLSQMLGGEMDPFTTEINGSSLKLAGFMFGDSLPELPATFADGALKLEISQNDISIVAQLLEDGNMSLAMSASGQSFEFIMEKA